MPFDPLFHLHPPFGGYQPFLDANGADLEGLRGFEQAILEEGKFGAAAADINIEKITDEKAAIQAVEGDQFCFSGAVDDLDRQSHFTAYLFDQIGTILGGAHGRSGAGQVIIDMAGGHEGFEGGHGVDEIFGSFFGNLSAYKGIFTQAYRDAIQIGFADKRVPISHFKDVGNQETNCVGAAIDGCKFHGLFFPGLVKKGCFFVLD
ncbi:MAG: hypothetical protein HW380_1003 [Magnetococcales bacterium]|nr:hypothetical protein [Magnetococcales bacterium]